jgi:Na+-translocating ferredoxin:NAD+ oxidoreductase RnfG subunit
MSKKNLMPIIVLTAICITVAAILAAVNALTEPKVRERNEAAVSASLSAAMPGGQFNAEPDELKDNAPETITKVYTEKNGKGTVVVLLTNKGYTGKNIGFTVGIDADGKITGLQITQNEESIVPPELKPNGSYGDFYVGAGSDEIPELSTSATVVYTEGAIKSALEDAFIYLGFSETKPELPRDEAEIEALAKEFYGEGAENLESSKPEDCEYVMRVYKEDGKNEYVAYAFTYSQYGSPEFEFLVHVDAVGNIKAIKKILWKVSDPNPDYPFYVPPTEAEVDAFFESFVGKNAYNINSVDVSTGATNTSGRVKDAVIETLKFAKPIIPREISEIGAFAKELYGKAGANLECIEIDSFQYARLVFKESGSDSYIAYALVYSPNYGTPELEFLVYVEGGTVKAVKKILWKVSDPKPEWGYNPPSEAEVDAFFHSFVGKNANSISSVDISTGATNTSGRAKEAALQTLQITFAEEDGGFKYWARTTGIAAFAVGAIATATAIVINKKRRAVKK